METQGVECWRKKPYSVWIASLNPDSSIYSVPRKAKGGKRLQEQLEENMRGVWRAGSGCRGGVCGGMGVLGYRWREGCKGMWKEGVTRHLKSAKFFLGPRRVKRLTRG